MNTSNQLAHIVLVGHSGRWRKKLSEEFRERVSQIIASAEHELNSRFPGVSFEAEFFPSAELSSEDDIKALVAQCSLAILDCTDSSEDLAFLAGTLAAKDVKTVACAEATGSAGQIAWPLGSEISRYNDTSELDEHLKAVPAALCELLEVTPVTARLIHTFWFPREVHAIWVVCPQISDPGEFAVPTSEDYTYLDNLGDTDSLLEIMVFLSRYYPTASIEKFSSQDFPTGLTKGNLVVIGGPGTPDTIGNELARRMMEARQARVSYSEDCESMIVRLPGERQLDLRAKLSAEDGEGNAQLLADYGYFARFPNPANEGNHVVCINGIHTIGVLGAARAFGDGREALRNYVTVLGKLQDRSELEFECFFEANVLNRDVRVPSVDAGSVFPLGASIPQDGEPSRENQGEDEESDVSHSVVSSSGSQPMLEETRSRLKVVNVLARKILKTHGKIFERTSAILLLHALEDLPPFLEAFESLGLSPADSLFYYKRYPYLNKEETLSWLRERGYQAEPMEGLQDTMPAFLAGVGESRRIVVLEDGGYIGPNLHSYENTPWEQIDGAVEQTERGVRMYEAVGNLRIPVAPVARCGLKNRQEPPHIGRTIVSNIQQLLPGRNLAGTRCVVIGYGHIGAAVCNAARAAGMIVSVYDADHGALAKAAQESFDTRDNLRSLLGDSQMVIGTTGNQSLGQDDILSLPHGMVLVSGSSGQYEIGIEALDVLSCKKTALDVGTAYTLEKEDREVILLGDGYPINFVGGNSVPDEAIDPVLGALLVATIAMVHEPPSDPGIQLEWTNDTMSRYELEKLYYNLYFS